MVRGRVNPSTSQSHFEFFSSYSSTDSCTVLHRHSSFEFTENSKFGIAQRRITRYQYRSRYFSVFQIFNAPVQPLSLDPDFSIVLNDSPSPYK